MTQLRHRASRFVLAIMGALAVALLGAGAAAAGHGHSHHGQSLWRVYDDTLARAKYVDLTHTITPSIPVWAGFGPSIFAPTVNPTTGMPYTYANDGFEATPTCSPTDQLGTQLDPPAHWAPEYPAIDELPPTFAVRPLVVISIVDQVTRRTPTTTSRWRTSRRGRRSTAASRGLGRDRPLGLVEGLARSGARDADAVPGRVAGRAQVPPPESATSCSTATSRSTPTRRRRSKASPGSCTTATPRPRASRTSTRCPRPAASSRSAIPSSGAALGGYARYIAICPTDWKYGVRVGERPEAPLQRYDDLLHWDAALGMRIRG